MKFFDEIKIEKTEVVKQQSKVEFQKMNLLKSVGDFSNAVLEAIQGWLFSFPTGMTRDAFDRQIKKISSNEEEALKQLKESMGFRVIQKIVDKLPVLTKSYIEMISEGKSFITIKGTKSKCEKYVLGAINDLASFGEVYVLDCAVLFADLKSSRDRGDTDIMLSKAKNCDFLIIENLAGSIGYVSNVAVWSLTTLVNARYELGKPILSRYNSYRKLSPIYEKCEVYELGV